MRGNDVGGVVNLVDGFLGCTLGVLGGVALLQGSKST